MLRVQARFAQFCLCMILILLPHNLRENGSVKRFQNRTFAVVETVSAFRYHGTLMKNTNTVHKQHNTDEREVECISILSFVERKIPRMEFEFAF